MVVAVIQFNFLFCVGMLISLIADNRLWSALFPSVSLTQNIHLYVVIRQNCGCHLHMYAGVYWRDFSCWLFLWSRASESPAIGFEVLYSFLFHWLKTSLVHSNSAELSTVELRTYVRWTDGTFFSCWLFLWSRAYTWPLWSSACLHCFFELPQIRDLLRVCVDFQSFT